MGSSQSTWGVSLVTPAHTEPSLIMVDAEACKKICDIYDWDGKGELDLFYLGDIMYAMGFNTTKSLCWTGTDRRGRQEVRQVRRCSGHVRDCSQDSRQPGNISRLRGAPQAMTKTPTAP